MCAYTTIKKIRKRRGRAAVVSAILSSAVPLFSQELFYILMLFCHMAFDINELASSANEHDILMNSVCFSDRSETSNCSLVDTQDFAFPPLTMNVSENAGMFFFCHFSLSLFSYFSFTLHYINGKDRRGM